MPETDVAAINLSKTDDRKLLLGLETITLLHGLNSGGMVFSAPALRAMSCQWPYNLETKTVYCDESGKIDYSALRDLVETNLNAFLIIQRDIKGKYTASYFVPQAAGNDPYVRTMTWENDFCKRLDTLISRD